MFKKNRDLKYGDFVSAIFGQNSKPENLFVLGVTDEGRWTKIHCKRKSGDTIEVYGMSNERAKMVEGF